MTPGASNALVDRGHLIPHLSGGEFGPNIFRQDRKVNRGWSEAGKRYRSLEREAASTPRAFYLGHLIYAGATDTRRRSRSAFSVRNRSALEGSTTAPPSDESQSLTQARGGDRL